MKIRIWLIVLLLFLSTCLTTCTAWTCAGLEFWGAVDERMTSAEAHRLVTDCIPAASTAPPEEFRASRMPGFGATSTVASSRPGATHAFYVNRRSGGLPLRAFVGEIHRAQGVERHRSLIVRPTGTRRPDGTPVNLYVPTRPLWGGLLVNVIIWFLVFWLALSGIVFLIRRSRSRRHPAIPS